MEECAICLEKYDVENPGEELECKHVFHHECLSKLASYDKRNSKDLTEMYENNTYVKCPICRKKSMFIHNDITENREDMTCVGYILCGFITSATLSFILIIVLNVVNN